MALFLSTVLNKMDSKCRVSVPSNFRSSLKNQSFKGVVAFSSYNDNSIDACGIERMERFLTVSMAIIIIPETNSILYHCTLAKRNNFHLIRKEELFFQKLINHAQIEKNVLFVWFRPNF